MQEGAFYPLYLTDTGVCILTAVFSSEMLVDKSEMRQKTMEAWPIAIMHRDRNATFYADNPSKMNEIITNSETIFGNMCKPFTDEEFALLDKILAAHTAAK